MPEFWSQSRAALLACRKARLSDRLISGAFLATKAVRMLFDGFQMRRSRQRAARGGPRSQLLPLHATSYDAVRRRIEAGQTFCV